MKIIDVSINIKRLGNVLTLAGISDLHLLADTEDKDAYQPLDIKAYRYLQRCMEELRSDPFYKNIYTFTAGDLTEIVRSSVRKLTRTMRKNDKKAEDTIYKHLLANGILGKIERLTQGSKFLGGVAGNHLVEFFDQKDGANSEEWIIRKLGGTYLGDCKGLINFHFEHFAKRCIRRVVIVHGNSGGSKSATINELKKMYDQYGEVDLLIKAHSHDPMAYFYCRYRLPDRANGEITEKETLVVNLSATRTGEKIGYDDYTERGNYMPGAKRFPMVVFNAQRHKNPIDVLDVKLRPFIM